MRINRHEPNCAQAMIAAAEIVHASGPSIDVEVTTSTAPVDLAREGLDAAVRTAPLDMPPAPTARRLQPVLIAPLGAPKLAASAGADSAVPVRLLGSKVRARDWAIWHRHAGLPGGPSPLLFESTSLVIQAALKGLAVAICSPDFVGDEVRTGRLVVLSQDRAETDDC